MFVGNILKASAVIILLVSCSQNQSEKGTREALEEAGFQRVGGATEARVVERPEPGGPEPGSGDAKPGSGYAEAGSPGSDTTAGARQDLGGISVALPPGWQSVPPTSSMRVAEYRLDGAEGEAADVSLAVFKLGGSVEANIERWYGQFSQPDGGPTRERARRRQKEVDGVPVSLLDIGGTFAGMGRMGSAQEPRTAYRMLGAVAEGPQGLIFFKVTGPQEAIEAWAEGFDRLIDSIRRG